MSSATAAAADGEDCPPPLLAPFDAVACGGGCVPRPFAKVFGVAPPLGTTPPVERGVGVIDAFVHDEDVDP